MANTFCPCGSNKTYSECCELFISGKQLPSTPEALMRSRYTAYTQANIDYIANTMKDAASRGFNPASAREWASTVTWLSLQVLNASPVTNNKGFVEFIARYRLQNQEHTLHEISEFHLKNGRWYYVDGKLR